MSEKSSFHFTGICGTAMGSAAVAIKERGFDVTGSDENVYPPMSTFLEERGIAIAAGYRAGTLAHQPDPGAENVQGQQDGHDRIPRQPTGHQGQDQSA